MNYTSVDDQTFATTGSKPARRFERLAAPALLLLGMTLCGCIPLRFTTSPGAKGKIVDDVTHAPISGAEVAISHSTYPPESPQKAFANRRSPTVMTRDDGSFSVPVERRIDLYCVPVDAFPRFGLLVIKRQGYLTACVPFWSHSVADVGEIRVTPGTDPDPDSH